MNLVKFGGYEAGLTLATDKEGYEVLVAIAKGTFTLHADGFCTLARPQVPPVKADEHHGEPGLSSVRVETDFATFKPKTDVILNGHACAPGGRPAEVVDTQLSVGSLTKSVRVFGDRIWKPGLLVGHQPSAPVPFTKMPLIYERAFGGVDATREDDPKFEMRNPVGRGFHRLKAGDISGSLLPNLENPAALMSHPYDTPEPAGYGFVGRAWHPRRTFAGTYDEEWKEKVFPFLPADFDNRYFQGAPQDQICGPLKGGEKVVLKGFTPDGPLEFALPSPEITVKVFRRNDEQEDLPTVLDTVLFEADHRRCVMVWRASARLKGKAHHVKEVWVGAVSPARRKALETGKEFLDWAKARG